MRPGDTDDLARLYKSAVAVRQASKEAREERLEPAEWQVLLSIILGKPHHPRQLGLPEQTVRRALSELHKAGFIAREPDETNRKRLINTATPRGVAALDAIARSLTPTSEPDA